VRQKIEVLADYSNFFVGVVDKNKMIRAGLIETFQKGLNPEDVAAISFFDDRAPNITNFNNGAADIFLAHRPPALPSLAPRQNHTN